MAEVVILGAGLTGLSAAYHFEQLGFFDIEVYEQESRPGGLLRSVQQDGFTFDHTGHLLHVSDSYFQEFLNTVVGMEHMANTTRRSAILLHDLYTPYPFQMYLYGHSPELIAECIQGYTQRKANLKNPPTFYQWVLKYFGAGFGKHFFFPYNSKLLCRNVRAIHPSWTGRFVPQTSLSAIIKGAVTPATPEQVGYNSRFWYPKQGGIQLLIDKLTQAIRTPVQTAHRVEHIDTATKTITFTNGKTTRYGTLISTMPLDTLLQISSTPSRSLLKKASQHLRCTSVLNLNIGFKNPAPDATHWVYLPEQKYVPYRLGYWHNLCPSAVPTGSGALYSETSYLRSKTSSVQLNRLIDQSRAQALALAGVHESQIQTECLLQLKHAYVVYDAWRETHLPKLLQALEEHHIISTGRFGSWKYSSMQEAVLDGRAAALAALPRQFSGAVKTKEEVNPPKHIQAKQVTL